jgi:hypothetical protein
MNTTVARYFYKMDYTSSPSLLKILNLFIDVHFTPFDLHQKYPKPKNNKITIKKYSNLKYSVHSKWRSADVQMERNLPWLFVMALKAVWCYPSR